MQDINTAYETLGDPQKKQAYDKGRQQGSPEAEFSSKVEEEDSAELKEDWKLACKFCPTAKTSFDYLNKLSPSLAFSFAAYLLDAKDFNKCLALTRKFEGDFLKTYFGSSSEIQNFASRLLLCNEVKAAKALNRAVKVMGKSLEAANIYSVIDKEFPQVPRKILFFRCFHLHDPQFEAFTKLMSNLGSQVKINFFFSKFTFSYKGENFVLREGEIHKWVLEHLAKEAQFSDVWQGPLS